MGGLLADVVKTACITLMGSAVVKVLGQKETSDIIRATGISLVGVQTLQALQPLIKGVKEFNTALGENIDKISGVFDKLTFWN
jgi:hypothetical protein